MKFGYKSHRDLPGNANNFKRITLQIGRNKSDATLYIEIVF